MDKKAIIKELKTVLNLEKLMPTGYIIKKNKSEDGIDGHIVPYVDRNSYIAEQYKVLRTDFYFLSPEAPLKSVVMTSSRPQEGKTITAANLATAISLDEHKKVVLIDGDLRKPAIHDLFGIPRNPGFTDLLDGNVGLDHFMEKPVIESLHVIPAGSPCNHPAEKLNSERVKHVIDELKKQCDYIIFDTPPVLSATDASILGTVCDGTLLVIRAGVTKKEIIREAYATLQNARVTPKGCILTNTRSHGFFYDYYDKTKSLR